MGIESADVPRVASGFGGGVGGGGSLCGALAGAVLAIGLKHGRTAAADDRGPSRTRSLRLLRQFEAEMGSADCRELTGFDLSTPEGHEGFAKSDVRDRVCRRCVMTGARLAQGELAS